MIIYCLINLIKNYIHFFKRFYILGKKDNVYIKYDIIYIATKSKVKNFVYFVWIVKGIINDAKRDIKNIQLINNLSLSTIVYIYSFMPTNIIVPVNESILPIE